MDLIFEKDSECALHVMQTIRQVPDRLEMPWATGIDWPQQKRVF